MKKNLYVLYDKNAGCVRCDGCFERDTDALLSFLCRLPNYSLTIKMCEVRSIGSYDLDSFEFTKLETSFASIPWSNLDFSILPDNLVNNLKIAGAIPSDDKDSKITFEFLDKRLTDIEEGFKNFTPILERVCNLLSKKQNEIQKVLE